MLFWVLLKSAIDDQFTACYRILQVGRECALAYRSLLELVHQTVLKPTAEQKARLPTFSKEVAITVADIVRVAEEMRADWVNPLDPHVIAENELLQAAASIEAAAKKLSELQPRKSAVRTLVLLGHVILVLRSCDHTGSR